jgi:hypothetical protein
MQAVKAIPFHSFFVEVKNEHILSVCIAGHFATSIPITFYDFFLVGMYLTADTWNTRGIRGGSCANIKADYKVKEVLVISSLPF